jgi:hypothetical protein
MRWYAGQQSRTRYKLRSVIELPDEPRARILYAIGEGEAWSAAMLCPCGCSSVIQLSLLQDDQSKWRLSVDRKGRPTLYPSVWRTVGCKSHFFLRKGEVIWVCSLDKDMGGTYDRSALEPVSDT